jgi:hypothetical protein
MIMMLNFFFEKINLKDTFSFFFIWEFTKQILVWNYHPKGGLIKPKVAQIVSSRVGALNN